MAQTTKRRETGIVAVAWLLLVCILFSGCGDWRNTFYTESSLKRVAAKSLKEKYGEEFVIHRVWNRSASMFFATCSPKDDPEVLFRADICKNGDGVVADGYTQGVIAKELDEILRDDFHELFGNCYTRADLPNYYNVPEFENPKEVTLEEYIKQVNLDFIGYYVFIPKEEITNKSIDEEYDFFSGTIHDKIEDESIPEIVIRLYFVDGEMVDKATEYYKTSTSINSTFEAELNKYYYFAFGYPESIINESYEGYKQKRMEVGKNE